MCTYSHCCMHNCNYKLKGFLIALMCLFIIDRNHSYYIREVYGIPKSIHSGILVKMAQPSFELEFKGKLYDKYSVSKVSYS